MNNSIDLARRLGADMLDQIIEHGRVEDVGHAARKRLPVPTSFSRGSRTDLLGSATARPITEALRP